MKFKETIKKLVEKVSFQTFSIGLVTIMELTAVICGALHHIILLIGMIALLCVSMMDDNNRENGN